MKKVILVRNFWPIDEVLQSQFDALASDYEIVNIQSNPTEEQLVRCEIVFGNVSRDLLDQTPNLKWMHTQTAGVEAYLNLPEHVVLTNSSGAFGISIAEYMLSMTLSLLRNVPGYVRQQEQQLWKSIGDAKTLFNNNVTVIGLGDIGGRYAYLCHMMGAKVHGVVRNPRNEKPDYIDTLFTNDALEEAIRDADIVALALPGTSGTVGILSHALMQQMKKGAYVINVGRGTAIDQDALIKLLQNGHIGGAALDVTHPEPLPPENPLWTMPNVIITPHNSPGGAGCMNAFLYAKFLKYLENYIHGKPFERVVDRQAGY